MVRVLFMCASACYVCACLRGVKYYCLCVVMYICVQSALSIASVVGVCIVNENMCPLVPCYAITHSF